MYLTCTLYLNAYNVSYNKQSLILKIWFSKAFSGTLRDFLFFNRKRTLKFAFLKSYISEIIQTKISFFVVDVLTNGTPIQKICLSCINCVLNITKFDIILECFQQKIIFLSYPCSGCRTGEMIQWLRILAAVAEHQSSVPITHMGQLTTF